jgi:hypothetical protein
MCKKDQRYLFYNIQNNISFRACFLDIIGTTLRVTKYQNDDTNHCMAGWVTMPLEWIGKVETLEQITNNQLLLPSEILIEIDECL